MKDVVKIYKPKTRNKYTINTTSDLLKVGQDYVVKVTDSGVLISIPSMDYNYKTLRCCKNNANPNLKVISVFTLIDLPTYKEFHIDEESTEEMIVVNFK